MSEKEFVAVARDGDLMENGQKVVAVAGKSVLLCRSAGQIFAVENMCSHEFQPLQGGTLAHCILSCPLHGAEFDLKTGEPLGPPAFDPLLTFPIRVRDGMIEVRKTPNSL